jgi:hypothetical protein
MYVFKLSGQPILQYIEDKWIKVLIWNIVNTRLNIIKSFIVTLICVSAGGKRRILVGVEISLEIVQCWAKTFPSFSYRYENKLKIIQFLVFEMAFNNSLILLAWVTHLQMNSVTCKLPTLTIQKFELDYL